jgi:peptide/nickel transport system ATP-binding protein
MGVVAQMADTIAVMRYGELLEVAPRESFFENPTHPYTQALLRDALPSTEAKDSTSDSSRLLEIEDLKVHFPIKKGFFKRTVGHTKAVDGVTLSIPKGRTLALVGESGSGKSTIGTAILRLIDATGGSVFFGGVDLVKLSQKELLTYRRKIQIIFQDPYSALNPRMTIGEIIREGMVSLKVGEQKRAVQDKKIKALLVKVGLEEEHFLRYPHEFSGGQRQRIGIARALAVEPELIICDEPTSALDVSVRAQVLELLKELQEERGLSYLFITHDLSIIRTIADEVAVMRDGKIVEHGAVDEVMDNPQHAYTQKLLDSAPKLPK